MQILKAIIVSSEIIILLPFVNRIDEERNVTGINFDHPLYKNVFAQRVSNFQYPRVTSYFKTRTTAPKVLSLQDQSAFPCRTRMVYTCLPLQ